MKRKFLEDLGLEKEVIDKIIAENESDVSTAKADQKSLKQQLETVNQQLVERDNQLEELKKASVDSEKLQKQITALQDANTKAKTEYDTNMKALKLSTAIRLKIGDTAHDADLVAGLIDQSKVLLVEDGKISGLTEQLDEIKKEKAFLFKSNQSNPYSPAGGQTVNKNPFAKDTLNLTEQGRLFRDNPEQARQLASAAGVTI